MAFDYTPLKETADSLIKRFGQSVTFTRYTETYAISSPTSISSSTFSADVVILSEPVSESDGNAQEQTNHNAVAASSTAIEVGDIADINSESLRVISVNRVQPATTAIYYEVQFAS